MKYLIIALSLCLPFLTAQGSDFKTIRSMTNKAANEVLKTGRVMDFYFREALRIERRTAANGRTELERREAAIKEAMHKYACPFFDDSIDISRDRTVNSHLESLEYFVTFNDWTDGNAKKKAQFEDFKAALQHAKSMSTLELWSGGASGNNTAGAVAAIYDLKNEEILIYGYTNCGSDD